MADTRSSITRILQTADCGSEAVDRVLPLIYDELRRTASALLRKERRGHTLDTTELVHEAYLRLFDADSLSFNNRQHFFGAAATAMRRILVDHARAAQAGKRIPKDRLGTLEPSNAAAATPDIDLLQLDLALQRLAEVDPRKVQVVELRYFAGLSEAEVAEVLEVSRATITREWRAARRWLFTQMH